MGRPALAILLSLIAAAVPGAQASPLFEDDAVLRVTIAGPFRSLVENREAEERRYLPFRLEVDGETVPMRIRVRGHSRIRVCKFPPLRLDLSDSDSNRTVFAGQKKIKLVTHCRHHDQGEQDLLEEYLAYRILNLLSDASFRVRLLRIDYEDTEGSLPAKASPRYGFVIEPARELVHRLGAESVSRDDFPRFAHDREHAALVYVFQYLIGNTDWSLVKADYADSCCHNIRLVEVDSQLTMVPFDFDLAGLVNASYAFPDPKLRLGKVTNRRYRGVCTEREIVLGAIRHVKSRKEDILALPANITGLTPKNAKRAEKFLDGFFDRADDEEKLLKNFESRCI